MTEGQLFQPIMPAKRNFEIIVENIRRDIYTSKLKSGQKLPNEGELARQFNVGRSAIREALKVLELSGLLVVRRGFNGGTFVASPDFEYTAQVTSAALNGLQPGMEELIEVRAVIEVRTAELAAPRASAEEIATLEATVERMEHNLSRPAHYIGADVDFHLTIAEIAGNEIYLSLISSIRNLLKQDLNRLIQSVEVRQEFIAQHRAILEAIRQGDANEAGHAMRLHLQTIAQRLREGTPHSV